MTNLDKNRAFGTVIGGATGAAYHQDGKLFRSDGSSVDDEPAAAPVPVVDVAPEPAPEPAEAGVTREQLEALHVSKLKALMKLRGLTPETGPGSKGKNIEMLLANG